MRDWSDFDVFSGVIDMYMPMRGEGETIASQICTAVNKLVYKWYNDGDVYDNRYALEGWCNDLSSYANWLYNLDEYVGDCFESNEVKNILDRIDIIYDSGDYEDLLYNLCDLLIDMDELETFNKYDKVGSIHKCDGKFKFVEHYEDGEIC